jgi:hypothetical protein
MEKNPETLVTLGTQDTGRIQKKTTTNQIQDNKEN